MDNEVIRCLSEFSKLLNIEYNLTIGRKGKTTSIKLTFDKRDCFHLMGLQYISDVPELQGDRGKVFDKILSNEINSEKILHSVFYDDIKDRIIATSQLESILDSNDIKIFKLNPIELEKISKIKGKYLFDGNFLIESKSKGLYIFFDSYKNGITAFGLSLFPKGRVDYTKRQPLSTLLYKEKIISGKTEIQFDRLYCYKTVTQREYDVLKSHITVDILSKETNKINIRYFKTEELKIKKLLDESQQKETSPISATNISTQTNNDGLSSNSLYSGAVVLPHKSIFSFSNYHPPSLGEIIEKIKRNIKKFVSSFFGSRREVKTKSNSSTVPQKQKSSSKARASSSKQKATSPQHHSKRITPQSKNNKPQLQEPIYPFSREAIRECAKAIRQKEQEIEKAKNKTLHNDRSNNDIE